MTEGARPVPPRLRPRSSKVEPPTSRWRRTPTRSPSSSTPASSSAATTRPRTTSPSCWPAVRAAPRSRLSYLRELHGDLDGARVAMLQAEQATSTPEDRATIATLIGDQLLASRPLRRRRGLRPGPVGSPGLTTDRDRPGQGGGGTGPSRRGHHHADRARRAFARSRDRPPSWVSSSRRRAATTMPPTASPSPAPAPSSSCRPARRWTSSPLSPPTTATRPRP